MEPDDRADTQQQELQREMEQRLYELYAQIQPGLTKEQEEFFKYITGMKG